jgi:protein-S-isoprenylcysteine O-methyltransferase Ste14
MDPWLPKAAVIAAAVVMIAIRAPHGQRSRGVAVARTARGALEALLLTIAWMSFFVPFLWMTTDVLAFADHGGGILPFSAGVALIGIGLGVFHRSHADLGTNWSITLEIREGHALVTEGIYGAVRHPMYLGLLLYSAGQALVLPNWIAGPAYLVAMLLLVALRLSPEERLMRETFGGAWDEYAARTNRLVPGVW